MKSLRLLIFLCLFSLSSSAQSVEWQRQFSTATSISMAAGIIDYNDSVSFSAIGTRKWGYVVQNPPNTAMGIGLVRLNLNTGDTVFVKRILGWTSLISNMKILKSFEGNLVIASKSVGDTVYNSKILVQKLDTNGNSVWVLPLSQGLQSPQIIKVLAAPDGGTFILGSDLSTIGGFMDWLLIKVSYNGQLQWSRRFSGGVNWYCEANNIELLRNGNYLISGMAERRVWSVEVDADGNQVDQRTFYETPLQYLMLGGMVSQGYYRSYYSFGVVQSNPRRFYFSKKDSLFQNIWGGEQMNLLGQFYANTSGGYSLLLSGKATTTDSIYLNLIRDDSLVTWRRALPRTGLFPTNTIINDVAFDGSGSVVLCGTADRPGSTRDELFFMKISGIGLPYDPLADTVLLSTKPQEQMKSLTTYPNPTTNQIWFSGVGGSFHITLYAADGRKVIEKEMITEMPVSVSHLPRGLYTYRVTQREKYWVGKMVKE